MADYKFGLPENDPQIIPGPTGSTPQQVESTEPDEMSPAPDKPQPFSNQQGLAHPPQPKMYSDAEPLPKSLPEIILPVQPAPLRPKSAINRSAQFPVAPPPKEDFEPVVSSVTVSPVRPKFVDVMPPTSAPAPLSREQADVAEAARLPELKKPSASRPLPKVSTRPRRYSSTEEAGEEGNEISGGKPKVQANSKHVIGDFIPIAHYYFTQVKFVLLKPSDFFEQMQQDSQITEAAVFMAITLGISCLFQTFSGNFGAIFNIVGHIFCVLATAFMCLYAFKYLAPGKGDFKTLFQIFAYCQAPQLISWISLGIVPIGYLFGCGYSVYLGCIAFQKIYDLPKLKAGAAIVVLALVARLIAGILHLL